ARIVETSSILCWSDIAVWRQLLSGYVRFLVLILSNRIYASLSLGDTSVLAEARQLVLPIHAQGHTFS
ncbi:hypothetical protein KC19_6G222500, partial [Ceratodon purpureus]